LINNPKITIVTPVYNCAEYIERTIQSVLNQTYKNIEYIIIDGGSDDGTCEIIKKYSKHISFFISEKDQGMYDALYKGFELATGKYLAWINADDLYFEDAIKKSLNIMENNNYKWIVGVPSIIDEKNRLRTRILYHYPNFIIKNGFITPCFWGYIAQESTIFTRDLYIKSGKINKRLKYAGDYDLWKKFSNYTNLISINVKIGIFRKRKGQISSNQKIYLNEVQKTNCLIPFGKILRLIYSTIINYKNK
jgi:glycosyltransferase involved in cell wall biosynthesis